MRAVAFVADTEDGANRSRELLDAATKSWRPCARPMPTAVRRRGCSRRCRPSANSKADTIAPTDLIEALRARPGRDWLKSARRLAGRLNPLGIMRQQIRDDGRRRWCYLLQSD